MLYTTKSCWHSDINIKQQETLQNVDNRIDIFTSVIAFWASSDSWWELQAQTQQSWYENLNEIQSMRKQGILKCLVQKEKDYLKRIPRMNEENDFGSWNDRKNIRKKILFNIFF